MISTMTHDELNDKVLSHIITLVKSGASIHISPSTLYRPSINVSIRWSNNEIVVQDQGLMPIDTLESARDKVGLFAGHIDNTLTRFIRHTEEKNIKLS